MEKVLIFGHKNPDTDTICSSIAYADLKSQLGMNVEAIRLGELSNETTFALETFQADTPRLVTEVSKEASQVILVDHNEAQQSADDRDKVTVMEVIDHHRIGNFQTNDPLYMRVEPVGCTATIILKLYKEHGLTIPKNIAGLMLSAIISDTLLFKSPTCTEEDRQAAKELATIAGVNAEAYGLELLKAGADLSDKTVEQLLSLDAKEFPMGSAKVEIAQINAVDTNDILSKQEELEAAIGKVVEAKGLDLFMLVVTDILNNDSVVLAIGKYSKTVERAFDVELVGKTALLKGVVSRKKQIVPALTAAFVEGE